MTDSLDEPSNTEIEEAIEEALPNGLQSSGVLLAVDLAELRVRAASENCRDLIGRSVDDLIGRSMESLFGKSEARRLENIGDETAPTETMRSRRIRLEQRDDDARDIDCLAHRSGDFVMLELFDPKETVFDSAETRSRFRDVLFADTDTAQNIPELCERAAQRLQNSMSLRGVGVYAFDVMGNGRIVTVSSDGTYVFPDEGIRASRLPTRIRRPLERTRVRLVSNFGAEGVKMIAAPEAEGKIDLSKALLRAFSKEDEAYLEDFMPAKGFLILPIVADQRLWGIILCLDTEEFCPPLVDLRIYGFAAQMIMTGIAKLEAVGRLTAFRDARDIADTLESDAGSGVAVVDLLKRYGDKMLDVFGFEQAVVRIDGEQFALGLQDAKDQDLTHLGEWADGGIAVIDARSPKEALIGLVDTPNSEGVFLSLSDDSTDYIFFGRRDYGLRYFSTKESATRSAWRPLSATTEVEGFQSLRRAITLLLSAERERALAADTLRAEVQAARLRTEILNTNRSTTLSELAGSLAHEMNQPLTAIMNFVTACQVELDNLEVNIPADIADMMEDTVEQAARAGDLLARLRRFVEAGESDQELLDLNELIEHAGGLALQTSTVEGIEIEWELSPDLPRIFADRVQLEQVIFNLVRNATQAFESSGKKVIRLATQIDQDRKVRAIVCDSGQGVPDEKVQHLFQPFVYSTGGGMGMGLSISRKIIEAHGGHIEYDRRDGWTEFSFVLPITDEVSDG